MSMIFQYVSQSIKLFIIISLLIGINLIINFKEVLAVGEIITYYGPGFEEHVDNDGSVTGEIEIVLVNDTFQDVDADNVLDIGSEVAVNNIPDGLTASMAITGTSQAAIWASQSATEVNQWYSVTYGNGLFVAVASDGTNRVMTSSDGITWTAQAAAENNVWNSVTYGNGLFVAVASDGTNRVMTSTDGITWTAQAAAENNSWQTVTYGNGLFVAVAATGTNRVMTSSDGITWTAQAAAEDNLWRAVTYGNGLYIAISSSGTNRVMTSSDGITWTAQAASEANSWYDVVYGNGLYVAVARTGTNRVMTSSDGITWTAQAASEENIWNSVAYGNGLFVAIAISGTNRVMTSSDGITWTARAASEDNSWREIVYGDGIFVAVSPLGTNRVMISNDFIANTRAVLTLSGNATSHLDVDDVADITFEFDDSAFTTTLASNVTGATGPASSGSGIDFTEAVASVSSNKSIDPFPNNISIEIIKNETCVGLNKLATAIIHIEGYDATQYILADNERFLGYNWQMFIGNAMDINWVFDVSGEQTFFVRFKSRSGNQSNTHSISVNIESCKKDITTDPKLTCTIPQNFPYSPGVALKSPNSPKIYKFSDSGCKQWLVNEEIYFKYYNAWSDFIIINEDLLNSLGNGEDIVF